MFKRTILLILITGVVFSAGLISAETDLIAQAQQGKWQNTDNAVLNFGADGKAAGSVKYRMNVVLEDGNKYQQVLFTHPQWKKGGLIKGMIANITVPKNEPKLIMGVGFLQGASGTDGVKFSVNFLKPLQRAALIGIPLCSVDARFDRKIDKIECDLSQVAGETGTIILVAFAGNSSDRDWAVWTEARIISGPAPQPEPVGAKLLWSKKGHSNRIEKIEFSPNGRFIVSASTDTTAKVWNARNGNTVTTLKPGGKITCARFSPDSGRVVTTSKDAAQVWQVPAGTMTAAFKGHSARVWTADFSPDGNRIVTGSEDGTCKIWRRTGKKEILTIAVTPAGSVNDVTFHPRENKIAAGVRGKILGIWDAASGKQWKAFLGHSQAISCVSFHKNGNRMATTGREGKTIIWNVQQGAAVQTLTGYSFHAVSFSPDGKYVITGNGSGLATIWNVTSGKIVLKIRHSQGGETRAVDFSPNGKSVVTASDDGTIKVWEISL